MDLFGMWLITFGALAIGIMVGRDKKNDNKKSSN